MCRKTITKCAAEKILKYSNWLGKQCGHTKGKDSEKRKGKPGCRHMGQTKEGGKDEMRRTQI